MAGSQSNSGDTDADVQEQLLNYPSERNTSKRAETISPGAKFTAEHLMRHCPYTVTFDYINPSLWGVPAPEDADRRTQQPGSRRLSTTTIVADSLFNLLGGENAPEWDPAEFKAEKFDERSEAYQRQQNAHLAAYR
ncbi:hypothetical protein A1F94_006242 [Pyrenophora tritici-repentis]|nr:hypothetical protein A1F94_006242 [Pyrenophora tritici-repentis]